MTQQDVERAAQASLQELGEMHVDQVLALVDTGPVSYRDLYYRWERQNWSVAELDFTQDREQWLSFSPEQQRAMLFGLSQFYVGEERVTTELVPFVNAAPLDDQRLYLTTQLVDEARHTVFFDRFYTEVVGAGGDTRQRLAEARQHINPAFQEFFYKHLPEAAARVAREPNNLEALVEGITCYHILIEGTLALAGQRFILDAYRQADILPAFRTGFTAVARDESRHVQFGVKFLADVVATEPKYKTVIERYITERLPVALEVLKAPEDRQPPREDGREPQTAEGMTIFQFARNSLRKKAKLIGIDLPFLNENEPVRA